MNLNKIYEIFKGPDDVKDTIHIIGCGAVGSVVAEMLARFGFTKVKLYDFDTVEDKNIANQMFGWKHIGMNKAEATKKIMKDINPECSAVECITDGWNGQQLNGYVFVCPDSIEVRRNIFEKNRMVFNIKYLIDFRMGLFDGDCYIIDWMNEKTKNNYSKTMNFTDESVREQRSACHEVLSFCPTIRAIVAIGIARWVRHLRGDFGPTNDRYWYINFNPYNMSDLKLEV